MKDFFKALAFGGLFLIPFIVLYVENDYFFPYITGKNFAFRILVEIVTASWIILMMYDAKYRPKFSWILASFLGFLAIMFVANMQGQSPLHSFWSNFERMEGYVTLVHVFLYFIALGSLMTTQELWRRYFATTLVAATFLSIYAFGQVAGTIEHRYGGFRVDATLGNATYMAIYMFFHVGIASLMLFWARTNMWRGVYGVGIVIFSYLLIQTATRGTTLALIGFFLVSMLYIIIWGKSFPQVRKIALVTLIVLAFIVATFIGVRNTEFVQESPTLTRIANISLKEGTNRFNIWSMAFEGVKERPLLGWGQSNYNYVFNEYFRPELHGQEAWFDRVHNIVMDWLIAGGVLGLLAYFSILLSAVYYLFVRPLIQKGDETFSVVERGILLGLLAGYTIHNLFVFDNIVSYIFYGVLLGYIQARVGVPIPSFEKKKIDINIIEQIFTPVVVVAFVGIIYFVNVSNMLAAGDVINAFRTEKPEEMMHWFDVALSRNTFAKQEIREQLTQRGQGLLQLAEVSDETKTQVSARIETELLKQIEEKPGDARLHVFISSFYRSTNQLDKAREQLAIARSLSPNKQVIIFEQGYVELQSGKYEDATTLFKEAYDLGPQFVDSRVNYAMSAVYAGKLGLLNELIQTDAEKREFALNQMAIQAVYNAKMYPKLIEMLKTQVAERPGDKQIRTSLAYVLNESGDSDGAIEVLTQAITDIPDFEKDAQSFIASIIAQKAGTTSKPTVKVQ